MRKLLIDFVPGLIAGVVGGIAGYFVVYWISRQGFYAPVLPGALAGLACGLASRTDSIPRGICVSPSTMWRKPGGPTFRRSRFSPGVRQLPRRSRHQGQTSIFGAGCRNR